MQNLPRDRRLLRTRAPVRVAPRRPRHRARLLRLRSARRALPMHHTEQQVQISSSICNMSISKKKSGIGRWKIFGHRFCSGIGKQINFVNTNLNTDLYSPQILPLRVRGELLPDRRLPPLLRVQPPLDRQPEGRTPLQLPPRMSPRDGLLRDGREDARVGRGGAADGQAQLVLQGELGTAGRPKKFVLGCVNSDATCRSNLE